MYSDNGLSSYDPPEGLGATFGVRVADFSQITDLDIVQGRAKVETLYGALPFESETGYGSPRTVAGDGGHRLVRRADGRDADGDGSLTWYGFSLSAALAI